MCSDALSEFRQVQDKYKCAKSRRIFQHTVQATADEPHGGPRDVTITGTMLSLFQDHAFKGLQHLRRGHVLETHEAPGYAPRHLEFKAYPKFGNWGEPGYPSELPGPIVLSRKYSGSMIIVCCLPDVMTLHPATSLAGVKLPHPSRSAAADTKCQTLTPMLPVLTYKHPLGTSYCTSKNGFDNVYSQAAQHLVPAPFLDELRLRHGVTTLICEIMGLDEHAYLEPAQPYLIVHGLTMQSSELAPHQFPGDIVWPDNMRPVEHLLFDTFQDALAHFQRENNARPGLVKGIEGAMPPSDWAFQGEGYVALGANGERLKFKFWRYLMHREFRVIREAKACPTVAGLLRRFKIMGCTLDASGQQWWAGALQKWFLTHAGETGPFIAAKDAFLSACEGQDSTAWVDAQVHKLPLIIALQGVQCSGKSTLRQRLAPYVHWHGSQDEHGSVAALAQSLALAMQAHPRDATVRFVGLVDRCNKAQNERNNLEAALDRSCPGLFVLEYVRVPDVGLDELVQRFAQRHGAAGAQDVAPHLFSPYTVGMLRGMEILSQGFRDYMRERADKAVPGRVWHDDLLEQWHMAPLKTEVGSLSVQHPTRCPKPGKVVYSGFGVLLDPEEYGYDVVTQTLRPNNTRGKTTSQVESKASVLIGGALASPGKWYGTHVTHTFGPKDPLPEGVAIDITVTGHYERKCEGADSINLCGLTVTYTWQDIPCMGHITLFCAPGVGPRESNDVLAAAMDGTNQAASPKSVCTRTKLEKPFALRGFSGTWKR